MQTIQSILGCSNLKDVFRLNEILMKHNPLNNISNDDFELFHVMKFAPYATIEKHGFYFPDIGDFLYESEDFNNLHIEDFLRFTSYFGVRGKIDDAKFYKVIRKINMLRRRHIINFILQIEKFFSKYSIDLTKYIDPNLKIYRVTKKPYKNNFLSAFTSWSLYPQDVFCQDKTVCHIYVCKISDLEKNKIPSVYMEKKNPGFRTIWEFEVLLFRGINFVEINVERKSATDRNFQRRDTKRTGITKFIIHHISLINLDPKPLNKIKIPEKNTMHYGYHDEKII